MLSLCGLPRSRATAEALTSIEVVGGYLSDFYWPVIDAEFGEKPQPGREPYSEMGDAFATRLDRETGQIWLHPAMAGPTTSEDTHPALSERLAASARSQVSALRSRVKPLTDYWVPSLEVTTKALDRRWKDNILSAWDERHKQIAGRSSSP